MKIFTIPMFVTFRKNVLQEPKEQDLNANNNKRNKDEDPKRKMNEKMSKRRIQIRDLQKQDY